MDRRKQGRRVNNYSTRIYAGKVFSKIVRYYTLQVSFKWLKISKYILNMFQSVF